MDNVLNSILVYIDGHPHDWQGYVDAFACVRDLGQNYRSYRGDNVVDECHLLMNRIDTELRDGTDYKLLMSLFDMQRQVYFYTAPNCFNDYLIAIEYDRKAEEKFYLPRKHYLKPMVDAYQKVLDGKLQVLTLSMPKRAGKSQLGINFTLLMSGREPNNSSLMEGVGDDLVNSFYKGCLEYLQDKYTYHYYDIFPQASLVQTNADIKTFDLNRQSRFPTCMCRSIKSSQVGLSEATNLLYLDDCVEGREEALSRDRLDKKWEVISGDVIGRDVGMIAPIVMTGTRYSLYDPIGRLQDECIKQGWAHEFIEVPALDPKTDESNFEYIRKGKKIFTTQYFRDQRDMLSAEQFESEFQQQPFEAKGIMFPKDHLNYYINLPKEEPDAIVAVCDPAESGEDSTSCPIAAIYGRDVYIIDVVWDNSASIVTKPEVAKALVDNRVSQVTFESNNGGDYFARDVEQICRKQYGYNISVIAVRTTGNKQAKIEFSSDNIIKRFYFRDWSTIRRDSQYWGFMKEVITYTRSGKVPHDDAPDSLAMLENRLRIFIGGNYEIAKREF